MVEVEPAVAAEFGRVEFYIDLLVSRLPVAYANLGQTKRAREASARGLELVRDRRFPIGVALGLTMHAEVLRKTEGPRRARRSTRR